MLSSPDGVPGFRHPTGPTGHPLWPGKRGSAMLRCSSCDESRWVHVRFGLLAADLERLTGWTPYWCQACARRGWHHSRPTPLAFDALRRLFHRRFPPRLSPGHLVRTVWRNRFAVSMRNGRLLATAGGLVSVFALGLWMGALLFSGPTIGADRESLAAAAEIAPKPIAPGVPDKMPVESEPARETRPAATPRVGDSLPAVTAPVSGVRPAVTPAGEARGAFTAPAGRVRPAVTPTVPTKPVTRATTTRDQREPQRTAATVKPVPRAPEADAPTSAVRAGATASAAPLPRFRGSLAIRSEPRGALVTVDGRVVGPTPIVLKGVRAGSRVIRIESEGYERWSSAARVVANKETAIVATLQRN